MTTNSKTYSELMKLETFEERFNYLKIGGKVGEDTFGFNRIFYQTFLKTPEWKARRREIITRDNGRDLGIKGRDILGPVEVHHINPPTMEDVINKSPKLLDPENLITTSGLTHKAIHYSDENILMKDPIKRSKNDTCPWKKGGM